MSKATLCQILIVVCLSSVISNETHVPSPQESPHRNEDAGVGRIVSPPHPRATASLTASPAPRGGSSCSSPPCYSCCAEPWRSATWPMINAAGCRAKSSPFGGAVFPIRGTLAGTAWDLVAHRAVGLPGGRHQAAEPGVGAGVRVSRRDHRRHLARQNTPASPPAGCQESQARTYTSWRSGSATAGASWA